jgi:hypothetical protein
LGDGVAHGSCVTSLGWFVNWRGLLSSFGVERDGEGEHSVAAGRCSGGVIRLRLFSRKFLFFFRLRGDAHADARVHADARTLFFFSRCHVDGDAGVGVDADAMLRLRAGGRRVGFFSRRVGIPVDADADAGGLGDFLFFSRPCGVADGAARDGGNARTLFFFSRCCVAGAAGVAVDADAMSRVPGWRRCVRVGGRCG